MSESEWYLLIFYLVLCGAALCVSCFYFGKAAQREQDRVRREQDWKRRHRSGPVVGAGGGNDVFVNGVVAGGGGPVGASDLGGRGA